MANEVVWYGERGAVNALVTDLGGRPDVAAGVTDLLRAIRWADGEAKDWIDRVSVVTFLVEVGMGQFGNPDLILACRTGTEDTTHVVFIEVKVVPYVGSAMSNVEDTMAARSFNSSINGQMALRHRLAHALHRWDGNGTLAEPQDLHAAYQRPDAGLGDPAGQPRSLAKPGVLDLVRRHGLHGLRLDRYHLVAWTWDVGPFFLPAGGVPPDVLPLLLAPNGGDSWGETISRVGWVGFQEMEGVCSGDAYRLAVATMVPTLAPSAPASSLEEGEDLRTVNFSRFTAETMRLVTEVEELARAHFGQECVGRSEGSSSVTVADRVQLKIIPVDPGGAEQVLLGIRATLSPRDWCPVDLGEQPRLVGVANRRKAFFMHALGGAAGEPVWDAATMFQLVADRFPSREQT